MAEKYTTISIPTSLAEKIKKRIEGTGFNSISSYVTHVLRELFSNMEEEETLDEEEEEKIKERLKALGYID